MIRARSLILLVVCVLVASVAVQAQQFTPTNFQLVSSQRVSVYQYDYTYRVGATNKAADALDVSCIVTSSAAQTVVQRGQLSFGLVASGTTVISSDTLVIRQDRRYPLNWNNLRWQWSSKPVHLSPIAVPGANRTVFLGKVQLDGSGSSDPNGYSITYQWSLLSTPPNSTAQLIVPNTVNPWFVADVAGSYIVQLVVNNGFLDSQPALIKIDAEPAPPVILKPTLDDANKTTKTIDSAGGSIEASSGGIQYKLDVPKNALLGAKQISLIPIVSEGGLPKGIRMIAGARFEPEGLRFLSAATLTVKLPAASGGVLIGSSSKNDGTGFHFEPSLTAGTTITSRLMHFSDDQVDETGCSDLQDLTQIVGLTTEDTAQQRLAVLITLINQCNEVLDINALDAAVMQIHYDWFFGVGGVNSLISSAQSDPDGALGEAIDAFNSWYQSLYLSDFVLNNSLDPEGVTLPTPVKCEWNDPQTCTDLAGVAENAARRIANGFEKELRLTNDRCIAAGNSKDDEAWAWIRLAAILNLTYPVYENVKFDTVLIPELVQLKTCGIVSLKIAPEQPQLHVEEQIQLHGVALSQDGVEVTKPSVLSTQWYMKAPASAVVVDSSGLVRGVVPGTAEVGMTLYLSETGNVFYDASTAVQVIARVASVEVNPSDIILGTGVSKQFVAVLKDSNGNQITGPTVHWSSNAPLIASVDPASGMVVAGNEDGSAVITAEADGKTGTANVRVRLIMSVTITPSEASADVGGFVKFVATAKDADGDIILPIPSDITWNVSMPSVALLTMNYMTATASAVGVGTVTITVRVRGVEASAIFSVNKLGLFVKAKIGSCGWNALYCEFPAVLQPVPVTVMAGYRQSDGSIKYQNGIYIDARSSGGGGVGTTDQSGTFQFSSRAYSKTTPSIRVWIIPNGNTDASIVVGAITRDFCSADSNRIWDQSYATVCEGNAQCSESFSFSYKGASGRASVSVLAQGRGWISKIGQWWDTLLVVPLDMSLLGQPFNMTVGVTTSGSGGASGGPGTNPTQSGWMAQLNGPYASGFYNSGAPPLENSQSEIVYRWGTPLGNTMMIQGYFAINAMGDVRCYPSPAYPVDNTLICSPATSSFAQFHTTINGITSVVNTLTAAPVSFKVFSCSGTQY